MSDLDRSGRLRVSDADRDEVARILVDGHADGRLTRAEYDERIELLQASKTRADLAPLTADLGQSGAAVARTRSELVPVERVRPQLAVLSKTVARPLGRVVGRLTAVSVLGDVHLDLSHAVLDPAGVVVVAQAVLGSVNITVPVDARVQMTGTPLVGSLSPTREPGPVDGPPVVVKAFAGMGSVTIHRAETESR